MTLNEYQEKARTTATYRGMDGVAGVVYNALKLAGESGEIADKVGKAVAIWQVNITDDQKRELVKELGDALWHLAAMASDLGVDLNKVAETNLDKLQSRMERGVILGEGDNR